jgi:hypothetical protein
MLRSSLGASSPPNNLESQLFAVVDYLRASVRRQQAFPQPAQGLPTPCTANGYRFLGCSLEYCEFITRGAGDSINLAPQPRCSAGVRDFMLTPASRAGHISVSVTSH